MPKQYKKKSADELETAKADRNAAKALVGTLTPEQINAIYPNFRLKTIKLWESQRATGAKAPKKQSLQERVGPKSRTRNKVQLEDLPKFLKWASKCDNKDSDPSRFASFAEAVYSEHKKSFIAFLREATCDQWMKMDSNMRRGAYKFIGWCEGKVTVQRDELLGVLDIPEEFRTSAAEFTLQRHPELINKVVLIPNSDDKNEKTQLLLDRSDALPEPFRDKSYLDEIGDVNLKDYIKGVLQRKPRKHKKEQKQKKEPETGTGRSVMHDTQSERESSGTDSDYYDLSSSDDKVQVPQRTFKQDSDQGQWSLEDDGGFQIFRKSDAKKTELLAHTVASHIGLPPIIIGPPEDVKISVLPEKHDNEGKRYFSVADPDGPIDKNGNHIFNNGQDARIYDADLNACEKKSIQDIDVSHREWNAGGPAELGASGGFRSGGTVARDSSGSSFIGSTGNPTDLRHRQQEVASSQGDSHPQFSEKHSHQTQQFGTKHIKRPREQEDTEFIKLCGHMKLIVKGEATALDPTTTDYRMEMLNPKEKQVVFVDKESRKDISQYGKEFACTETAMRLFDDPKVDITQLGKNDAFLQVKKAYRRSHQSDMVASKGDSFQHAGDKGHDQSSSIGGSSLSGIRTGISDLDVSLVASPAQENISGFDYFYDEGGFGPYYPDLLQSPLPSPEEAQQCQSNPLGGMQGMGGAASRGNEFEEFFNFSPSPAPSTPAPPSPLAGQGSIGEGMHDYLKTEHGGSGVPEDSSWLGYLHSSALTPPKLPGLEESPSPSSRDLRGLLDAAKDSRSSSSSRTRDAQGHTGTRPQSSERI